MDKSTIYPSKYLNPSPLSACLKSVVTKREVRRANAGGLIIGQGLCFQFWLPWTGWTGLHRWCWWWLDCFHSSSCLRRHKCMGITAVAAAGPEQEEISHC